MSDQLMVLDDPYVASIATVSDAGINITFRDGTAFSIPRGNIFSLYGSLAFYMDRFGAIDERGREVEWPPES